MSAAQTKRGTGEAAASAGVTRLFVGTSGWAYPTWQPAFYPAKTPARLFLREYAERLNSVEVNYTFRSLPTAAMLDGWLALTPPNFRFSFKAPQRITHFSRLRECSSLVEQFVDALAPVRDAGRLGILLFQLPPNLPADPERLQAFLAASATSGAHASRIAFEFRHPSWFDEATYSVLRAHNAALCIAESDDLATPEVHTAKTHACFRLRRNGGYDPQALDAFARRFVALTQADDPREVFVYHKHEDEPTGALNATTLLQRAALLTASSTEGSHR